MIPTIIHADMREALAGMEPESVDAVVTDPPYHLTTASRGGSPRQFADNPYGRARVGTDRGFMGKTWDGGDIAFQADTWREALRVMKPGAHLLAFGGTRTFHRMAVAIEDAGFELRDTLMWLYGTGFPKSLNLDGDWQGWGTALKPAWEPIILARKPLAGTVAENVLAHGTGALNIDGCRVGRTKDVPASVSRGTGGRALMGSVDGSLRREDGTGSGFDPNTGRWPANVVHDGSDEVEAAFAAFGEKTSGTGAVKRKTGAGYNPNALGRESRPAGTPNIEYGDTGSASRFFYSAKATAADRAGSKHPTVKPVALMRWLVRMVTPPGGLVLDPFAGSGTTGAAAMAEGLRAILIEQNAEYVADIRRRFADAAPLFAGAAE